MFLIDTFRIYSYIKWIRIRKLASEKKKKHSLSIAKVTVRSFNSVYTDIDLSWLRRSNLHRRFNRRNERQTYASLYPSFVYAPCRPLLDSSSTNGCDRDVALCRNDVVKKKRERRRKRGMREKHREKRGGGEEKRGEEESKENRRDFSVSIFESISVRSTIGNSIRRRISEIHGTLKRDRFLVNGC